LTIGNLTIAGGLLLAPMAGITDAPYRLMARNFGCALAFSGMISAVGLALRQKNTLALLDTHPSERPLAFQLFGTNEERLATAAAVLTDLGADLIDLNCGCPVRKVVKAGAGAALMRDPAKIGRLVSAMRRATHLPITVKIRSGWEQAEINAALVARVAEEAGADALTVHPRTAAQGFSGRADWDIIRSVKSAVRIPVIGNGDVLGPADAEMMIRQTGCDAVMIGRASLGNPWIFSQALAAARGEPCSLPSPHDRREVASRHLELSLEHGPTRSAVVSFRRCLMWYSRGLPKSAAFREIIARQESTADLGGVLRDYFDSIETEAH
ncbi:MAG: tRNA dihydrouridine synthase DusB, partial [Pseudomonadota bacterium]